MKALISSLQPYLTGYYVVQVVNDNETFEMSPEFYWVDCTNDIHGYKHWYSEEEKKFFPIVFPPSEHEFQDPATVAPLESFLPGTLPLNLTLPEGMTMPPGQIINK